MSRKLVSIAVLAMMLLALALPAASQSTGEMVPAIIVHSVTQAVRPIEYETTRLVVENMRELGLEVEHRAIPWAQLIDEIWYSRTEESAAADRPFQMTHWRMVGRPERSDPDEFTYNLFHSSVRDGGYNFIGYNNPAYDALAEAQRVEVADKEARLDIICEAQTIIRNDMVNAYFIHPLTPQVVNPAAFNPDSITTQAGIGVHNFWTWIGHRTDRRRQDADHLNDLLLASLQPAGNLRRCAEPRYRDDLGPPDAHQPDWRAGALGGRERRLGRPAECGRHLARGHEVA